ncbi:MAG: Dabb family protein [Planctomycetota bacterium]|jgi:hypothetical protein
MIPQSALLCAMFLLAGCATGPERPAVISHVVLFRLQDPGDAAALLADCDELLPGIPTVQAFAAGTHLETGRATVRSDYDVGLYLGFDTVADYESYLEHPDHVALVDRWDPRLREVTVYDVADATP